MLASGMKEAMDQGSIRAVGVCNYNASQMEAIHSELAAAGIPLASNQVTLILSYSCSKASLDTWYSICYSNIPIYIVNLV